MSNLVVRAIMEDVYYPIEINGEGLTLKQAKKLLADLEAEIEILEWEEAKKKKANPDPEVSEKRIFAERMGMEPSSVYYW
jgi:hypothetical protein